MSLRSSRPRSLVFRWAAPLIAVLASSAGVRAEPVPVASEGAQRSVGVGATIGVWSGIGAIVGGGGDRVKGWLAGGYAPVLVFANARTPDKAVRFNAYNGYQINGDLEIVAMKRARTEVGVLLGYKFNSVIGHGGGAGVGVLYDLGTKIALDLSGGLAIFPSAKDRLDRNFAYPTDRSPGLTPVIQGGANLGLIFYP
jgi:hypothetical protein